MSATDETREAVERLYAAARSADFQALPGLLSDDLVVEEPPFLPYGGTYRGLQEFTQVFGEAAKVIDLSAVEVERLTVEGDRAYAQVSVPLVDGGARRSLIEEWTVAGGRIVAGRIFWFDPALREEDARV